MSVFSDKVRMAVIIVPMKDLVSPAADMHTIKDIDSSADICPPPANVLRDSGKLKAVRVFTIYPQMCCGIAGS